MGKILGAVLWSVLAVGGGCVLFGLLTMSMVNREMSDRQEGVLFFGGSAVIAAAVIAVLVVVWVKALRGA